ncbi:MAG: histidine phosphatase family protein [Alphaproteobacteria bacterium]
METPAWHLAMQKIAADAGGLQTDIERFYFLRHGETEHNKRRIIQTQRGVTLNDTGRGQARAAAQILKRVNFLEIHASDLERAWETAEIVNLECRKPIHKVPALYERNWGDWAGGSNVDLDWGGSPGNGETLEEFTLRTLHGFNEVLKHGEILVVAHGGNYAVLMAAIGLSVAGPPLIRNATPMRIVRNSAGPAGWMPEPL